jgi:hypothetical protein
MTTADILIGPNYWYGSNSLPDALEGLPQEGPFPRNMRRASEAVVQAAGFPRYAQLSLLRLLEAIGHLSPLFLDPISATLSPMFGHTVPTDRTTYRPRMATYAFSSTAASPVVGTEQNIST